MFQDGPLSRIKCISHPQFNGRTSIKVVLPVLVPDLSYDDLAIGNGDDAPVTYAMMAQEMMDPAEIQRKRAALLEYCERDTLAMVRLHEVVEGLGTKNTRSNGPEYFAGTR